MNWLYFEQWAVKYVLQFGMTDDSLDLVMWIVSQRVKWERTNINL